MRISTFTRAAIVCVALTSPLVAQDSSGVCCGRADGAKQPSFFARRSQGEFTVIQSRPTGDFGQNIGLGYGGNAAYLFGLDDAGLLSLRADVGFLQYGSESKTVPLSPTIGGRITVKVSTDNYIVPVSFGPQLTWPRGSVRPYVNAGVGGQFFYTQSSVDNDGTDNSNISTTNQHDQTLSWVAGGGVYVPVYMRHVDALLDIGVRYFATGHAQYLRPGSIQDLPNSQIAITPLESDTHMLLVHVGVKIAAGR